MGKDTKKIFDLIKDATRLLMETPKAKDTQRLLEICEEVERIAKEADENVFLK